MSGPEELDPQIFGPDSPCFGCQPDHPIGLKLRFQRDGDVIRTRYVPPTQFQGPRGILHGGLVTTLADELAAWTVVGLLERFGFTASLTARLSRPIRIGAEVQGAGTIVHATRRLVDVHVDLSQDEQTCFRGDFKFALLDQAAAERLLGGPLSDAWLRFCRS